MDKIHQVESKGIKDGILELIVDNHSYSIDLTKASSKLAKASTEQMQDYIISPSGYGIHWPQIDEDLAIDPLIGIQHDAPNWKVAEEQSNYITKKEKS